MRPCRRGNSARFHHYRHIRGKLNLLNVISAANQALLGRTRSTKSSCHLRFESCTTPQDLAKAVEVRASAYARHLPTLGQPLLANAEAEDLNPMCSLLLRRSKFDRRASARFDCNPTVNRPLRLEGEAASCKAYSTGRRLVETTRLGVDSWDIRQVRHGERSSRRPTRFAMPPASTTAVIGGRRSMAITSFGHLQFDELDGGPFPHLVRQQHPHWIFVHSRYRDFEGRLRGSEARVLRLHGAERNIRTFDIDVLTRVLHP